MQCVCAGLLIPLSKWRDRSSYYLRAVQIAIYGALVLMLIPGVWALGPIVAREYDYLFGLYLMFNAMTPLFLIAAILPLVDARRSEQRRQAATTSV